MMPSSFHDVNRVCLSQIQDRVTDVLNNAQPHLSNPQGLLTPNGIQAASVALLPNGYDHIIAVGSDGRPYDSFRFNDNTWAGFTDVLANAQPAMNSPGGLLPIKAICSAALPNGDHHIIAIGDNGRPYDAFRFNTNKWAGFTDVLANAHPAMNSPGGLLPIRAIDSDLHNVVHLANPAAPVQPPPIGQTLWQCTVYFESDDPDVPITEQQIPVFAPDQNSAQNQAAENLGGDYATCVAANA